MAVAVVVDRCHRHGRRKKQRKEYIIQLVESRDRKREKMKKKNDENAVVEVCVDLNSIHTVQSRK